MEPTQLILLLIVVGLGIAGVRANRRREQTPPAPDIPPVPPPIQEPIRPHPGESHEAWLLAQLDQPPFSRILTFGQREALRKHYARGVAPAPVATPVDIPQPALLPPEVVNRTGESWPNPAPAPPPNPTPISRPVVQPAPALSMAAAPSRLPVSTVPPPPPLPPAKPPREWDSAVLLLYAGAFLIVASGLLFAGISWDSLGSAQRIGLLAATTIGFGIIGWITCSIERVREAGETFIAIAALLLPANVIAIWSVSNQSTASTASILLVGSVVTSLAYGVFALRPGGAIYEWGCAISGYLAIAALAPAFGAGLVWSMPVLIASAAVIAWRQPPKPQMVARRIHRHATAIGDLLTIPAALIALIAGLGADLGNVGGSGVAPVTMVVATVAILLMSARTGLDGLASLATLPAHAAWVSALLVADVESTSTWAWSCVIATVIVLALVHHLAPRRDDPLLTGTLHVESAILAVIAFTFQAFHTELPQLAAAIFALAVFAVITIQRRERWWLLGSGLFAIAAWSITCDWLGWFDSSDTRQLFALIPLPIGLAAVAWYLDRWSEGEPGWGLPLWISMEIAAFIAIAESIGNRRMDNVPIAVVLATLLFGWLTLAAAASLRLPTLRVGYALWLATGFLMLAERIDLIDADRVSLAFFGALSASGLTVLGQQPQVAGRWNLLRVESLSRAKELYVFGVIGGLAAFGIALGSVTYVLDGISPIRSLDEASIRWTWICYLGVIVATALLCGAIGWRLGAQRDRNGMRLTALATGTISAIVLAALMIQRMLTQDLALWSWVGVAVSVALMVTLQLLSASATKNAFGMELARQGRIASLGLGLVAIAFNLGLVTGDHEVNDVAQVVTYGLAAIALLALAIWKRDLRIEIRAMPLLALATWFAVRASDRPDSWYAWGFLILAGAMSAAGFLWRRLALPAPFLLIWSGGTVIAGVLAVLLTPMAGELDPGTHAWGVLIATMVGLAVILAIEAWHAQDRRIGLAASVLSFIALEGQLLGRELESPAWYLIPLALYVAWFAWLRQDRRIGYLASAIAFLALEGQLLWREFDNLQWYTAPLAAYLFAHAWLDRRQATVRDPLLGGSALALLGPTFMQALENQSAFLMLAIIESVALVVIGSVLRLRVTLAAGVVGMTLIVLRMVLAVVLAVPSWLTLAIAGLALLVIGTMMLNWRERLRGLLDRLAGHWEAMG